MTGVFFFFFKQKTAYEMRISDWSSDVCSSDLLVATDLIERQAEDFSGGCLVNVEAIAKRRLQARIAGKMRHQPQFDLRIVDREQGIAGFGNERLADAATFDVPPREVLQVGLGRRQSHGRGARLRWEERRV